MTTLGRVWMIVWWMMTTLGRVWMDTFGGCWIHGQGLDDARWMQSERRYIVLWS
jgi:hypothetical protein